ncbi:MAG: hypothetical protein QOD02_1968, partial [Mycobacterium sp.]|nr:hypothetical protein [Mycobacterium sp.]
MAGEYSSLRRIPLPREMGKTLSGTRLHTVRGLWIDKSTLSVSPLLVIEAHSEKKGDRCGWCRKGVGLHRRRCGIV